MTTSWTSSIPNSSSSAWDQISEAAEGNACVRNTKSSPKKKLKCFWLDLDTSLKWALRKFIKHSENENLLPRLKPPSFPISTNSFGSWFKPATSSTTSTRPSAEPLSTSKKQAKNPRCQRIAKNWSTQSLNSTSIWLLSTNNSTSLGGCSIKKTMELLSSTRYTKSRRWLQFESTVSSPFLPSNSWQLSQKLILWENTCLFVTTAKKWRWSVEINELAQVRFTYLCSQIEKPTSMPLDTIEWSKLAVYFSFLKPLTKICSFRKNISTKYHHQMKNM